MAWQLRALGEATEMLEGAATCSIWSLLVASWPSTPWHASTRSCRPTRPSSTPISATTAATHWAGPSGGSGSMPIEGDPSPSRSSVDATWTAIIAPGRSPTPSPMERIAEYPHSTGARARPRRDAAARPDDGNGQGSARRFPGGTCGFPRAPCGRPVPPRRDPGEAREGGETQLVAARVGLIDRSAQARGRPPGHRGGAGRGRGRPKPPSRLRAR
jgi:hypothetical protein